MTLLDLWYWLINNGVYKHEIDKNTIEFLFDLYTQKNSQKIQRKTTLKHMKMQCQLISQFPDLSQFVYLKTLK